MTDTGFRSGYAPANGLNLYYELHGPDPEAGGPPPLLLLHGAFMNTSGMAPLTEGLARGRQVIVPDQRGHGRTGGLGPEGLSYEAMADDAAALLDHLGIAQADVCGYSLGGAAAIQVALRHPDRVRRLITISAASKLAGAQPAMLEMMPNLTPEVFAGSPMQTTYEELAPDPAAFPDLVRAMVRIDSVAFDWDISAIRAPTLIVVGDADGTTPEHAVEMLRAMGGGGMGDLAGLPPVRLAILPGTAHFIPFGYGVLDRAPWLLPMLTDFLDTPEVAVAPAMPPQGEA